MAGTYADVPAPRIAYDLIDVDVLYHQAVSSQDSMPYNADLLIPRNLTAAQQQQLNSDGVGTATASIIAFDILCVNTVTFIFRELYDIAAYCLFSSSSDTNFGNETIYTSTNTTNGIDGTWTLATSSVTIRTYASRNLFRPPTALSLTSIRAVQFRFENSGSGDNLSRVHLYGNPTVTPEPVRTKRLAFYNEAGDAEFTGANLDLGDVALSSSMTKAFRIRNYSPASTARNITLTTNQLYGPSTGPSLPAQYLLSLDGLTYTATVNIPYLYSGQYSDVIYVRKETPFNATTGLWTARVEASAEDWF